jgi:hypothetical protein
MTCSLNAWLEWEYFAAKQTLTLPLLLLVSSDFLPRHLASLKRPKFNALLIKKNRKKKKKKPFGFVYSLLNIIPKFYH